MAWFLCNVGNGGSELTVTCDSVFAGATITCTDGVTTLIKTCPSSSPYIVKFNIPNSGIWTVSSGASSTSVVITDSIDLHDIPVGATVIPTDDVETWLHCANIWNKSYTTINQVLADTSTLLALISSNNAADYMARSTNWASSVCANQTAMGYIGNNNYCANKLLSNNTWRTSICNSTYFESVLNVKVPTMTSDTAPSGEVSYGSSTSANYLPYTIFNPGIDSGSSAYNCWQVEMGGSELWVQYKFTQKVKIYLVTLTNRNFSGFVLAPQTFKIQMLNDGANIADISGILTNSGGNTQNASSKYVVNGSTGKNTARFVILTAYSAENACVGKLQFYGRVDI